MKNDIISEYPHKIEKLLKFLEGKANPTRRNGKTYLAGMYAGLYFALKIYYGEEKEYEEIKSELFQRYR